VNHPGQTDRIDEPLLAGQAEAVSELFAISAKAEAGISQDSRTTTPRNAETASSGLWKTPNVPNRGPEKKEDKRPESGGEDLQTQAMFWLSPAVPNGGRMGARTEAGREGQERHLEHQSLSLTGLQAQPTATSGGASSRSGRTSRRPRLNPEFVRWLMGFAEGWAKLAPLALTSFERWVTLSSRLVARLLS
jgi:hypothetical protein